MDWEQAHEPLRDVFHRRRARGRLERLPEIWVELIQRNFYKAHTTPLPDKIVQILNGSGERVGSACYGITPLQDQLWLYELKISSEHQRCGYGLAFLRYLHQVYALPITPIHEVMFARPFWQAVRRLNGEDLQVQASLSMSEVEERKSSWGHLGQEQKRLLDVIHARLAAQEAWDHAVGRGIDE